MTGDLGSVLDAVLSSNGSERGKPVALRRQSTPYVTTFPCVIVNCRFADGAKLRLFCKYGAKGGGCSYGQRGGVDYEAEVYRHVLQPSGFSTPLFYGSHVDPISGGTWLIIEYLGRSLRAGKVSGLRAMRLAARWIGEFHAANEARAAGDVVSFLTNCDAAWYRGWPRRAFHFARRLKLHLPWLPPVSKQLEDEIASLAVLPRTIIHGEYYPHNIMYQAGRIRPVDWETAAIAPGEVDVATMTEGWPLAAARELEAEYKQARWPAGPPANFERNLTLARAYMQLRWIGDDDPRKSSNMTRWRRLYDACRRLHLIERKEHAA